MEVAVCVSRLAGFLVSSGGQFGKFLQTASPYEMRGVAPVTDAVRTHSAAVFDGANARRDNHRTADPDGLPTST